MQSVHEEENLKIQQLSGEVVTLKKELVNIKEQMKNTLEEVNTDQQNTM
jgi:hypothetical protein